MFPIPYSIYNIISMSSMLLQPQGFCQTLPWLLKLFSVDVIGSPEGFLNLLWKLLRLPITLTVQPVPSSPPTTAPDLNKWARLTRQIVTKTEAQLAASHEALVLLLSALSCSTSM